MKVLFDVVVLVILLCFNLEGFFGLESINVRFVVLDVMMGVYKRIFEGNVDVVEFCFILVYYNFLVVVLYIFIEGLILICVGGFYFFIFGDGVDYNF